MSNLMRPGSQPFRPEAASDPAVVSGGGEAATPPVDPAEAALEQVEQVVGGAREDLADARDAALERAETDAERSAIMQRFDGLDAGMAAMGTQVVEAIRGGNESVVGLLTDIRDKVAAGGGAFDDLGDNAIVSVEEVTDGAGDVIDAAEGAAAAVTEPVVEAAEEVVDTIPRVSHPLFKGWGGGG